MRFAAIVSSTLLALTACDRAAQETVPPAPVETFSVSVSDELPNLSAPATGIAFWEHPTLSFNSLMIVTNKDGLISYNIEDGNEVSRAPGFNARGAGVSYLGFGVEAAGVVATFDADESVFRLYGIDNASRAFIPVDGGPAIRGAVRGFCFGRARDIASPSLFVVQKGKISIFNFEAEINSISVSEGPVIDTPDNLVSCTIDVDGVVIAASEKGELYRLDGVDSFEAPIASAGISNTGDIAVTVAEILSGEETTLTGQILLLNIDNGALHIFDRNDGRALGVIASAATDELEGVDAAYAIGVTSANLGALYRNGVIAFAVGTETPVIRLIPVSGVMNALSLPEGESIAPRGAVPVVENDGLLFETSYKPE